MYNAKRKAYKIYKVTKKRKLATLQNLGSLYKIKTNKTNELKISLVNLNMNLLTDTSRNINFAKRNETEAYHR